MKKSYACTATLFDEPIKNRPYKYNEEIVKIACEKIIDKIDEWGQVEDKPLTDSEKENLLDLLKKETYHFGEGYELAKSLEREGYCPDSELVEILDNSAHILNVVHEQFEKKWVEENGMVPLLKVGEKVSCKRNLYAGFELLQGEISSIYPKTAKYSVFIEKLGHVKSGVGTHGIIYDFEMVEGME